MFTINSADFFRLLPHVKIRLAVNLTDNIKPTSKRLITR